MGHQKGGNGDNQKDGKLITPEGEEHEGVTAAEQNRGEGGFVRKRVCEVGLEDLFEMLRWKNKTKEAEKCSPYEEKHKVQLPSL